MCCLLLSLAALSWWLGEGGEQLLRRSRKCQREKLLVPELGKFWARQRLRHRWETELLPRKRENLRFQKLLSPTLQSALTSAGKSSEVMRLAIGWTPRLTKKTKMQPKTTLLQSMITACSSKCQCSKWVAKSRVVPKTARLQTVATAEAR